LRANCWAARPRWCGSTPSEFGALSGGDPAGDAAARFAKTHATVVALTGGVDRVTDGVRRAVIANGDPLMGVVTAMGCAGSALVCAALAVETDAWLAATAAVTGSGSPAKSPRRMRADLAALPARSSTRCTASMPRHYGREPECRNGSICVSMRLSIPSAPAGAIPPISRVALPRAGRRWCSCATSAAKREPWSGGRGRSRRR
jgi:hypothetical protein